MALLIPIKYHYRKYPKEIQEARFICDYVFLDGDGMKYNPVGPAGLTVKEGVGSARSLREESSPPFAVSITP